MALWGLKLLDEGVDTHFLEDAMTNSDLVLRFNAASIACHLPGMEDAATQILDTLYSQSSDSTLIRSEDSLVLSKRLNGLIGYVPSVVQAGKSAFVPYWEAVERGEPKADGERVRCVGLLGSPI